jgi:hypothetical protein
LIRLTNRFAIVLPKILPISDLFRAFGRHDGVKTIAVVVN